MLTVVLANIIHVQRVRHVYGQFSLQRLLSTAVGSSLKLIGILALILVSSVNLCPREYITSQWL